MAQNLKMPRTKRGANRQANALVNMFHRKMAGGARFGIDWPTVRAWFPKEYGHIQSMKAVYKTLPD